MVDVAAEIEVVYMYMSKVATQLYNYINNDLKYSGQVVSHDKRLEHCVFYAI